MRLFLATLLCLSLVAGAFGDSYDQSVAVGKLNTHMNEHFDSIQNLINFVNHRFGSAPKALAAGDQPGPCDGVANNLFSQFQNDPNCGKLFSSFGENPLGNKSAPGSVGMALDAICKNPCYPTLINGLHQLTDCLNANGQSGGIGFNTSFIDDLFGLFCMKNPANDQYCLALMSDPALLNITGGNKADNATACDLFAQFGCCIGPVFHFVDSLGGGDGSAVRRELNTVCGFGVPPPCPRPGGSVKFATASWRIKGIAFAYFIANKAALSNALRNDISVKIGCDKGYISFTKFSEGSLIADFNVRGQSDTETNGFATQLATASADTTTAFPSLSAAAGSAGLDAGSTTVGIDTTKSTSSITTYTAPGSGTNVQPMFALVAALLAFTLFARQ